MNFSPRKLRTSKLPSEITSCSEAFRPTWSSSESTEYLLRSVIKLCKLGRLLTSLQKYVCVIFSFRLGFTQAASQGTVSCQLNVFSFLLGWWRRRWRLSLSCLHVLGNLNPGIFLLRSCRYEGCVVLKLSPDKVSHGEDASHHY